MSESESNPPPSASAFLQKHTHHSDGPGDESSPAVSVGGRTDIVSNIIEGIVGAATPSGGADDDAASMKHRKESSRSYDQRLPKTYDASGDEIPFRGFGDGTSDVEKPAQDAITARPVRFAKLRHQLRGLFSPRATDIQQLLIKLQTQFQALDLDFDKYALEKDGSMWDEGMKNANSKGNKDRNDPKHPLNNPKLMTEVHFVGRKAIDQSIVDLTSLLITGDKFGSITELWLNDNLISDDGAAVIATFLQRPTCALVELWLGNNQIGPSGTTLISAALSDNNNSQVKCLGLYKNPIGNGGASTLAQMLRVNHLLSTVDIHGCGRRNNGNTVLEGYGCKVITASDGTEYVAKVIPKDDGESGIVTDQRLLDAIQTFVAFNRINPTREQAIRGMMTSNKHVKDDTSGTKGSGVDEDKKTDVSKFLSELCNQPPNEHLTDQEKREWKYCEWERLHVELERARTAKSALANRLRADMKNEANASGGEIFVDEEEGGMEGDGDGKEESSAGMTQDLDSEVVSTDSRSYRDLKMGITGSPKPTSQQRKEASSDHELYVISDAENETQVTEDAPPPQTEFV